MDAGFVTVRNGSSRSADREVSPAVAVNEMLTFLALQGQWGLVWVEESGPYGDETYSLSLVRASKRRITQRFSVWGSKEAIDFLARLFQEFQYQWQTLPRLPRWAGLNLPENWVRYVVAVVIASQFPYWASFSDLVLWFSTKDVALLAERIFLRGESVPLSEIDARVHS